MPDPDADRNQAELEAAAARRRANDELAQKQKKAAEELAKMQKALEKGSGGTKVLIPLALATATALGVQGPSKSQDHAADTSRISSVTNARASLSANAGVRVRAQLNGIAVDTPTALSQQRDERSDIASHRPVSPHDLELGLEM